MFTDQPLYRAGALEPIAGYTDVIFLVDAGGPVSKYDSPYFGINAIRPFFGPGNHGLFIIYSFGAAPAGYGALPAGVPTGAIAAGGNAVYPVPAPLNLGSYGFVQARFTLEQVGLAGPVFDDLDLLVQSGAIADFGLPQAGGTGHYNAVDQFQSPSDVIVGAASGVNKLLPAAFPQVNPWDEANLTELYWFEGNAPTFTLQNNGIATTAGIVGLRLKGFRYMLRPLTPDDSWRQQFIAGALRLAPPGVRIVCVPTVPPTGTTTF